MQSKLVRLLGRYILLAISVVLLNFFLPRLLPGDPLSFSSGEGTDAAVLLSAATKEQLREYYHLDESLDRQLLSYLGDLGRRDLGWSISRSAPVSDLILDHLRWTLALLLVSFLISAVLGTALGMLAGWSPDTLRDRLLVSLTTMLAALPEFLVAIGLLLVLAVGVGWFPLFGAQTVFASYGPGASGMARYAIDITHHLTLPALALIVTGTSGFVLLVRDSMRGVRQELWLTMARGKGLREWQIAWRHALPNLAFPLLTFAGLRLGTVFSGALVVERVFNVPGLGLLAYQAIRARDYPVLQAVFLLSSLGVLIVNLGTELLYLKLDTRRGSKV